MHKFKIGCLLKSKGIRNIDDMQTYIDKNQEYINDNVDIRENYIKHVISRKNTWVGSLWALGSAAMIVTAVYVTNVIVPILAERAEAIERDFGIYKLEGTNIEQVVTQMKTPEYIPEGYVLIEEKEAIYSKILLYKSEDKEVKIKYFFKRSSDQDTFNGNRQQAENVSINGFYDAILWMDRASERAILYWDTGIIQYSIETNFRMEENELFKIAESIMK